VGVNTTPEKATVVDFVQNPLYFNTYTMIAKDGLRAETWTDLNRPDVKIAVESGSAHETIAKRFAPKAQLVGVPSRDASILALQSGRADAILNTLFNSMVAVAQSKSQNWHVIAPAPYAQAPSTTAVA